MPLITPADLASEGITSPPYEVTFLQDRITTAQGFLERFTGKFFEERALTLNLDGSGSPMLCLPVPISSKTGTAGITSVVIDRGICGFETLVAADFRLVQAAFPDGRYNPRVIRQRGVWPRGVQNIAITATWGFVEPDGKPPIMAIELMKRLAVWALPKLGDADAQRASQIVQETLGNYTYRLSEAAANNGFFGDHRIDTLIAVLRGSTVRGI